MVMQIQVQIGDTRRVFFVTPPGSVKDLKTYILREIPKTRFMDFGLLCENDKGEYVVLSDVRMAYIRLASLVYLLVYVSTYCVPIAHFRQNKPFPLLYLGHAQLEINQQGRRSAYILCTVRKLNRFKRRCLKQYKFIYTYVSLHLADIYQNFQSHKEKRTYISLDKNSNTEFYTEDILSRLNSTLQRYTRVK